MTTGELGRLAGRDFLDVSDLSAAELRSVLDLGHAIREGRWHGRPLEGAAVAVLFQKPSQRTRVSFEVGIARLGGQPIVLDDREIGLGSRESAADVGRVLERYTEAIVARLFRHSDLVQIAEASSKPVVNALTDHSHPCQVLADMLTVEQLGASGRIVFVGDGNNVASSLVEAAALLDRELTVVSPPGYLPPAGILDRAAALGDGRPRVRATSDLGAVEGAAVVYTDVWTSMGQEAETETRRRAFSEYQVNSELMASAPGAIFMHCLPAHRGEEVTAEVIDGPASVVFQQAENRLYAQMALLACLAGGPA